MVGNKATERAKEIALSKRVKYPKGHPESNIQKVTRSQISKRSHGVKYLKCHQESNIRKVTRSQIPKRSPGVKYSKEKSHEQHVDEGGLERNFREALAKSARMLGKKAPSELHIGALFGSSTLSILNCDKTSKMLTNSECKVGEGRTDPGLEIENTIKSDLFNVNLIASASKVVTASNSTVF
ncbi:hypothetical protein HELRODRAFT_178585 [Helobdella robusta]|uniref:Uncharacterized protein n=1 Tax=Helobdella robusta TaxID=6412 RepID=T1FDF1_HELRO|nr:hypothetical protein HELRODRAFT_178585 [Helobdella robusta]ESN97131.1 hypothetical protein HELRODRAFT_178585 [Helobdella robusta]